MSKITAYCPKCGTSLASLSVCPLCSFNTETQGNHATSNTKPDRADGEAQSIQKVEIGSDFWKKIEPPFALVWPWLWRIVFLTGLGLWIWSFIRLFQFRFWFLITFLLNTGSLILLTITYSLYLSAVMYREYHFIANDTVQIGKLRIPKILVVTFGITLGFYLWGGLLIFIPVILLLFLGPSKTQWIVGRVGTNTTQSKQKVATSDTIAKENKSQTPIQKTKKKSQKAMKKPPKAVKKKKEKIEKASEDSETIDEK